MIVAEVRDGGLVFRKAGRDDLLEAVYILTLLVPLGSVASYSSIAKVLGISPRAVARYLSLNREHIVVPCHRVVRANGDLGGYTPYGSDFKRRLLELEGVELVNGKVPKKYFVELSGALASEPR